MCSAARKTWEKHSQKGSYRYANKNTDSLEDKWPIIENAPGVEIISKPKLTEYPGYGGVGKIPVMVSKFYDADGYILEVN